MERSSTKKKILVTGAQGQLGTTFQKIAGEYPALDFFFPAESDADITDPPTVIKLLSGKDITAVINCAAYTAVDKAEAESEKANLINNIAPAALSALCRENGIPLIHFSTDYVFDGQSCKPYDEQSLTNPLGVYGQTKLEGEKAIRESGCDALVIRTSWLYSEFGNNFVLTMLRLSREGKPLKVVCDQYGTPTYATDLARAAVLMLMKGFEGFNLLHYSAKGYTNWYEFAIEIFRQAGINAELSPVDTAGYPTRAARPSRSVMSMAKAESLGLALRPWQDALAECIGNIKLRWKENR